MDWIKKKFKDRVPSWDSGLDTQKEVHFLISTMGLTGKEKILDLGCGNGRHAIYFAGLGYEVTAIDMSETLIAKARKDMSHLNIKVNFICGDYLSENLPTNFDVILNLYDGGIGYFNDKLNKSAFKVIERSLKKGGYHFTTLLNKEYFQGKCPFKTWKTTEECLILTKYEMEKDRLLQTGAIIGFGESLSKPKMNEPSIIKLYSPNEIKAYLNEVGMTVLSITEKFNFDNTETSRKEMAVLSKKN